MANLAATLGTRTGLRDRRTRRFLATARTIFIVPRDNQATRMVAHWQQEGGWGRTPPVESPQHHNRSWLRRHHHHCPRRTVYPFPCQPPCPGRAKGRASANDRDRGRARGQAAEATRVYSPCIGVRAAGAEGAFVLNSIHCRGVPRSEPADERYRGNGSRQACACPKRDPIGRLYNEFGSILLPPKPGYDKLRAKCVFVGACNRALDDIVLYTCKHRITVVDY